MYTCRTCKLLKCSKAKKAVYRDKNGTVVGDSREAHTVVDFLSEWHCPYYGWTIKPQRGFGCKHYQKMNGRHWI